MNVFISSLIIFFVLGWNHFQYKRKFLSSYVYYAVQFLFLYHTLFSFFFTIYIESEGGDAWRYWHGFESTDHWSDFWGSRSEFIKWLNFMPSHQLGLSFWVGNLIYAAISYIGFRQLLIFLAENSGIQHQKEKMLALVLVLCMPNVHFWTAGIGKEALLWLALTGALLGMRRFSYRWLVVFFFIGLAWWIRPINGLGLGLIFGLSLIVSKGIPKRIKYGLTFFGLVLGYMALEKIKLYMAIPTLNWAFVQEFSQSQFDFLSGFQAGSEVPMAQYNIFRRIWVLFFRPLINESTTGWYLVPAIENSLYLLSCLLAIFCNFKNRHFNIPVPILMGILFGIFMASIYALTLNNLGIIVRMKSIYMPFFYLANYFLIASCVPFAPSPSPVK
ncbi:MAG: hypothetical protein WDZ72_07080 [Cyclobacteriaceae bacterium]